VQPAAAPSVTIYGGPDAVHVALKLPPADLSKAPGLFAYALHLDARFRPGDYGARFVWDNGAGGACAAVRTFSVPEGGDTDGAVIALYNFQIGPNVFLVQQLDSRKLVKGRNPRV
jgi:hypothetical protein